jgi:hypothetical protein
LKLISTSGVIASKNNCPAAGQFLYDTCHYGVNAVDAAGVTWSVGAPAQVYTNGNCGTFVTVGPPLEGQCGFPPIGWSIIWTPQYITVDPIYWSHPDNPQAGQLAYAGGQFLYTSSNTYYTNYPDTYTAGWIRTDQELLHEVEGVDGWRLQIRFLASTYGYSAVEDDLTPEGMPDPEPSP